MRKIKVELFRRSGLAILGGMAAILSGLASAAFIPLLFYILSSERAHVGDVAQLTILHRDYPIFWVFILMMVVLFFGKAIASLIFSYLSVEIFNSRVLILSRNYPTAKFMNAKSKTIELNSQIAQSFERFTNAINSVPILISSVFMLIGYYYVIFLLNPSFLWRIVFFLIFGIIIFCLGLQIVANAQMNQFALATRLFQHTAKFLLSLTEIRHSALRREHQISGINEALIASGRAKILSDLLQALNNLFADTFMLSVLFLCTYVAISSQYVIDSNYEKALIIFIASIAPISVIIQNASIFATGMLSYRNLNSVIMDLPAERAASLQFEALGSSQLISYSGIEKRYKDFHLGAVTLDIRRNAVTFLVGGNGSGKSTLMRILSLDDLEYTGSIAVNSVEMGDSIHETREKIGCVFTDYAMPLTLKTGILEQDEFELWCDRFGVTDKVSYVNSEIHFKKDLSDGQRTRVALAIELSMPRKIYFFDEITAAQDPYYRNYFFNTVLPYIKSKGRAVIMITHDERFFQFCDHLYKLDFGKLSDVQTNRKTVVAETIA